MITVILRGKLQQRYAHPENPGGRWHLDAHSPAEALHAIDVLMGGFFDYIMELESEMQGYHVQVGERTISEDLLAFGFSNETVTITPLLQGADTKGIIQIVAGVALIAVAIAAPYIGGPLAAFFATSIGTTTISGLAVGLGVSIALGGIARLLISAPHQTVGEPDSKTRSS